MNLKPNEHTREELLAGLGAACLALMHLKQANAAEYVKEAIELLSFPQKSLQAHCMALALEHGSFRAAADHIGIDHAYLLRLARGANENPSDDVLAKLGLFADRVVVYRSNNQ